ncbi:hypothetical protein CKJ56_04910 [Mycobacterium intracellulare subsp. chimaera]|nr:hypothetical protein CKJ58_05555 [Mycobacterium intracellulare subsp. chimaera]PBA54207.1 hypothetical protein CKJ57_05385 [Mycobacterium intracellulare subsp. chimaera]PBA62274.1 hypothetical protein CKJ56_04910 [Mycobacterium intracellulare subsp. chimaera]
MIPPLTNPTGVLPLGRYPATVDEIRQTFVDNKAARRQEVWDDWNKATALLRSHVPVCAVWLSGSFLTQKDEPDDVDCVYWVEDTEISRARLNRVSAAVIDIFAQKDALRNLVGLRVDTFIVPWHCSPDPAVATIATASYFQNRGHWDDFWQRMRSGAKGAQAVRADALPRRGYLEVILDGFR